MESQEEEEESFGKFTPKEYRKDLPERSSVDQGEGTQPPSLPLSLNQVVYRQTSLVRQRSFSSTPPV
jgi:hypothetical protein